MRGAWSKVIQLVRKHSQEQNPGLLMRAAKDTGSQYVPLLTSKNTHEQCPWNCVEETFHMPQTLSCGFLSLYLTVLVRISIAIKRHHSQGNSYKGQHFIEAGPQVLRFSPLSSWSEARQGPGRHIAGKAESSTSSSKGSQEQTVFQEEGLKVHPHTSSNKDTPLNSAIHWAKYIQTTTFYSLVPIGFSNT